MILVLSIDPNADKGGGVKDPEKLADVICERPQINNH